MNPLTICNDVLGRDKLSAMIGELSTAQFKSVLREGQFKLKKSSGFVSQKEKRRQWSERILTAVESEADEHVASQLLQQWLLFHRRLLLIDYLNALEVKHRDGETDENFLVSKSPEQLHQAALGLLEKHDRLDVAGYLHYIDFQQKAEVFADWPPLQQRPQADSPAS